MPIRNPTYAKYNKLIDHYDYVKDVFNHRPCKDRWLQAMGASYGDRWKFIRPITNKVLQQHENNEATLYICANSPKVNQMGQVGFDIDAGGKHGIGTKEGAIKAAKLIAKLMPGLYTEPSTHGIGQHAYYNVAYGEYGPEDTSSIKDIIVRLTKALDQYAKQSGCNIKIIEPKGLPANIIRSANGSLNCTSSTMGVFIKCPRDIAKAVNTCVYTVDDLEQLAIEIEAKLVPPSTALRDAERHGLKDSSGSNFIFRQSDFDAQYRHAKEIYEEYNLKSVRYCNRGKLLWADLQIFMAILKYCYEDPNEDGSLPNARIIALWRLFNTAGISNRKPDGKRIATLRNLLSDCGWIKWQDNRYRPGSNGLVGQAMKWAITSEFYNVIKKKASCGEQQLHLPIRTHGLRPINSGFYSFTYDPNDLDMIFYDNAVYLSA